MSIEAPRKILKPSSLVRKESSSTFNFIKYHGLGSDFILVDNRDSLEPRVTLEQVVKLCDQNYGIGADGVIFVMPVYGTDYRTRIFNSDGSESELSANGMHCFAQFIAELENVYGTRSFTVHTGVGFIALEIHHDERMLLYEYVDNGNLEQWFHGDVGHISPLTWEIRMNTILRISKGLMYLHEGLKPKVAHRDVKSCNILFDKQ